MATMKRILSAFIVLFVLATSSLAATEALQIDALWSGINNPTNGKSYSGAIVATFAADGSTAKAVWENKEKTQPSTLGKAQFTLDSNGQAEVFGDGVYVIKVYAPSDTGLTNPLMTFDGLTYIINVDPSNEGVDSVDDLRGGSGGAFDGYILTLLGYYSPGDGGGQQLYWDESSTSTDNGFSIFKVTSITTGRWLSVDPYSLTVDNAGAKADGTDDTAFLVSSLSVLEKAELVKGKTYSITGVTISIDGTTICGEGTLQALNHTENLVLITGDDVTIKDISLRGDGTTEQSTSISEGDRICLIKSTGDRTIIKNTKQYTAMQIFNFMLSNTGSIIRDNEYFGGVAAMTNTGYQGVRASGCTSTKVIKNDFYNVSGSAVVQVIIFVNTGGVSSGNLIDGNTCDKAFDHGIYMISSSSDVITNNIFISDGSGIVVTSRNNYEGSVNNRWQGTIVKGNQLIAGTPGPSTVGLFLRDVNQCIADSNEVYGFPTSISLQPIQYDTTNNTINNNKVTNNTVLEFSITGINMSLGGLNLGEMKNNLISGNNVLGNNTSGSVGIFLNADLVVEAHKNKVTNNIVVNVDSFGMNLVRQSFLDVSLNSIINTGETGIRGSALLTSQIKNNFIVNSGTKTTDTYYGIDVLICDDTDVNYNKIESNITNRIKAGIMGNNTCTAMEFIGNKVKGSVSNLSVRQGNQYTNTIKSNKIGDDTLVGTVTLGAAATTVVNNDCVEGGGGVISTVSLIPSNPAAAVLMGSSKFAYAATKVTGVSFSILTADGTNAVGTEVFIYEIY